MLAARINRMQPAITVLTHSCSDVRHPSVLLQTKDGKRYIFGQLGEGFQRSLVQHKTKSTKLSGIFLSGSLRWSQVSGLPGYLLSLAEVHKISEIHGGLYEKTNRMIASWKHFTFHTPLDLSPASPSSFRDENISVESVILGSNGSESASFIVQLLPSRGKFLVSKAKALGVPAGAMYGKLSSGESVVTPEGRKVEPHEVVGPSPTPCRVLILDLPTQGHVQAASNHKWDLQLKRKRDGESEYDVNVSGIYYFLGSDVNVNSADLASIAAKYPNAHHFVSHPSTSPDYMTLTKLLKLQNALRQVIPDSVPRPYEAKAQALLPAPFIPVKQNDVTGYATSDSVKYVANEGEEENECSPKNNLKDTEPTVVTLGTGSSAPSNYRNVSSTLVRVPTTNGARALLFDCGEGALNTLKRLYGPDGLRKRLHEIDTVYISHMHADHHLGLLTFIRHWQAENKGSLNLLGPAAIYKFASAWESIDVEEVDLNRLNFVDLESFIVGSGYSNKDSDRNLPTEIFQNLGFSLQTCRAVHCDRSYSCVLDYDLPDGETFRVAYSGDTRPNKYFAQLARNCNVLIHEATHEDELLDDAIAKRHSTISEALGVGRDMMAENIVLTHFSQRYPRLASVQNLNFPAPTCFAFDGLHIAVSGMRKLQESIGAISDVIARLDLEEEGSK